MKIRILAYYKGVIGLILLLTCTGGVVLVAGSKGGTKSSQKKLMKKTTNTKTKGKKNKGGGRLIAGHYYDPGYNVLIGEDEELRVSETYVSIEETSDPNLFMYRHCWRRPDPTAEWIHEKGGMVLTGVDKKKITFLVAETFRFYNEEAIEEHGIQSAGYLQGHFDGTSLQLYGIQAGLGLAFVTSHAAVTNVELDENACPV